MLSIAKWAGWVIQRLDDHIGLIHEEVSPPICPTPTGLALTLHKSIILPSLSS